MGGSCLPRSPGERTPHAARPRSGRTWRGPLRSDDEPCRVRRRTMQAWRRWLAADVATKQTLAWEQYTLQEERRDQRRLQPGVPFSERERARLTFLHWLYHTGRLGPPGYDSVCTRHIVTRRCCLRSRETTSRATLRRRALQLALVLLLVALAATWLVDASTNGPGGTLPGSPPAS